MSADTIQNQAPLFIVFDGMDGTGKTTQMRLLCERLNSLGMETVLTCEPSTSPDGQALRRALSGKEPANNSRMAALFLIDRIGHNAEIEGWLAEGKTVISDRYYYASMAYQGQGENFEWVARMNLDCPHIRKPDGAILLDMNPEDSMARIRAGRTSDELEIYETVAQQEKIRAFLKSRLKDDWGEKELRRAVDALLRRGHSYREIRSVLDDFAKDADFQEDFYG